MFVFLSEGAARFPAVRPLSSDRATMRLRLRISHHEMGRFLTITTGHVLVPFSS
jgi:hypothetical protein